MLNIIYQLVHVYPNPHIMSSNPTAHSISVTAMSRLMLNLHSTASAGILSTLPTPDTSSGVAFTSRAPDDLPFAMNSFEMQATVPTQSLQADIAREAGFQVDYQGGREMARKGTVTRSHWQIN